MKFVGVDFHRKYSYITEMDKKGNVSQSFRLENNRDNLCGYAKSLPSGSKVAVEATCNWYYFYELMEDYDLDINLAHPLKTKAIASARIKTDKIDSKTLAHLLRSNLLPASYIPSREVRDIREILRYRASLISFQTRLKNKVDAILSKNGLESGFSDMFGKGSIKHLKELELRPCYKKAIDGYLELASALKKEIKLVEKDIESLATESHEAHLIDTMPGISYYSSLLIISEIGDIKRFPTAGQLCSYAGLVPSVHSSGDKTRTGPITKQGSRWLRWILVECAHHAVRKSLKFKHMYERISFKHGNHTATISVARKMLRIIFYMLKKDEPFRDDPIVERQSGHRRGVMTH